ncbi:hypothetical protein B4168_3244 [Anoxybacillus flavithermus]|nr:hypothetical protein B4168_3244 [Anoxybacillus flavithermus]OAO88449.1 hypothetical protein GT23_0417 [Parageobacillus thermoglucosidasius]
MFHIAESPIRKKSCLSFGKTGTYHDLSLFYLCYHLDGV